ncbi:MAG: hypothetical protein HQK76_17600 [Desulfobacterales bacterium]|nr:hypothetical protein [Desulfobacterales bacterium]
MMKVKFFVYFCTFLFIFTSNFADSKSLSNISDSDSVTLIFTGNTDGEISPFQLCGCAPSSGGLARRAYMANLFRRFNQNVILLDIGGIFSTKENFSEDRAKLIFESMNLMGYSCLNLSHNEFIFGIDSLTEMTRNLYFPIVTSNIIYKSNNLPFKEKYLVKNFGEISFGIIGVVGENFIGQAFDEKLKNTIIALPPEKEIKKILSEIRPKVDVVILLSHCGYDKTVELINSLDGIDLAISTHKFLSNAIKVNDRTKLIALRPYGPNIDFVTIFKDSKNNIFITDAKVLPLDDIIPSEKAVSELIQNEVKKEEELKQKEAQKETQKLNEQLKLTPEQFMKMMMDQQQQRSNE